MPQGTELEKAGIRKPGASSAAWGNLVTPAKDDEGRLRPDAPVLAQAAMFLADLPDSASSSGSFVGVYESDDDQYMLAEAAFQSAGHPLSDCPEILGGSVTGCPVAETRLVSLDPAQVATSG